MILTGISDEPLVYGDIVAVPTRKTSHSVTKKRRTHKKLAQVNLITCSNCQELIIPHQVCPKCGHYHGEQIIAVED